MKEEHVGPALTMSAQVSWWLNRGPEVTEVATNDAGATGEQNEAVILYDQSLITADSAFLMPRIDNAGGGGGAVFQMSIYSTAHLC